MQPPPRRSALAGFLRTAAILAFVFLLLCLGYYLYNVLNRAPANVYTVRRRTAVSAVYGTVTITANAADVLLSQNAGYLHMKILGTPSTLNGQTVKANQLIATVDDETITRAAAQAQRDLDAATAHFKSGPTLATALQAAKDQMAAYDKLAKNQIPEVTRAAARGEVTRLQSAYDLELVELQHAVDSATTAYKAAAQQLERTEIKSQIDGVLTAINYDNNTFVQSNQALFTVSSTGMYVSGEVNEEDVGALQNGMEAELRLYSYPNTTFKATVNQVLPAPTVANGSRYAVFLSMDDPPDNLRYGLTGEMNIILGRKPNAITIPTRALNTDQVLIVDHGVVAQRTVKVGFKSLEFAEILDGINEGDQVIVSDQDAFRSGERVRPVQVNVVRDADK